MNGLLSALLLSGVIHVAAVQIARAEWGITEQAKLLAPDGAALDNFGKSVFISGNLAIMGSWLDDDLGNSSGSAYIFRYDGSSWNHEAKLTASDGAAGDEFGRSVFVSGNLAVVGTWRDDDHGTDSGSAYVFRFDGTTWSQEAKLTAEEFSMFFGVSVSADGDKLLVGAHGGEGVVYIFEEDSGVWTRTGRLSLGSAGSGFGFSVSLYGNTALIGAPELSSGTGYAYIYEYQGIPLGWQRIAMLSMNAPSTNDRFGHSVSLDGGTALVGSFGDDDGGSSAGAAYVYHEPPSGWENMTESAKLTASDGAAFDQFGITVSLRGNMAFVGAPNSTLR